MLREFGEFHRRIGHPCIFWENYFGEFRLTRRCNNSATLPIGLAALGSFTNQKLKCGMVEPRSRAVF